MLARRPAVSFAHKEKLSYEQRCYESTRVREKYSDRFPVIVERDSNSDVPAIDKCAQTPRMQEATHTLTIRCMHILHTRAGHTLRTPARGRVVTGRPPYCQGDEPTQTPILASSLSPSQVSAYRGGLNAPDRRRIERQLYEGELRGVTAVSLSLIFVCCACGNKWVG